VHPPTAHLGAWYTALPAGQAIRPHDDICGEQALLLSHDRQLQARVMFDKRHRVGIDDRLGSLRAQLARTLQYRRIPALLLRRRRDAERVHRHLHGGINRVPFGHVQVRGAT